LQEKQHLKNANIYADLIIIPLILIYRKYYGVKAVLYITGVLFVSMVSAGIIVDLLFGAFGLIPGVRPLSAIAQASFQWNYTTWLDFAAILLSGWFVWIRFRKETNTGTLIVRTLPNIYKSSYGKQAETIREIELGVSGRLCAAVWQRFFARLGGWGERRRATTRQAKG
jgi:hypothetical protein